MSAEAGSEDRFASALAIIRKGDFDEVKSALENLGFEFRQGRDSNHWSYFHQQLKKDLHFAYPRNLYRPHGSKRSSDRISRHDQSQARQMVDALRAVLGASEEEAGGD